MYPVEELCTSSVTLRGNLWKTIVVKSSPLVISTTESRLSASIPKRMPIDSGSNVNLLGSDN
ncbi:hypothetical protein BHE74_00019627 [Ensete ventricosum]|nr:hypothetical protein BHE74_00019627 [Ensete ventricosum]